MNREDSSIYLTLLVVVIVILFSAFALAHAEEPIKIKRPGKITCAMVKSAIAIVGVAEAERLARKDGASEASITKWKKCT